MVRLCVLVAVRGGFPSNMPESGPAPQLILLSGCHFEFVVDQRVDHAPTLGLTLFGAIVCTAYRACVTVGRRGLRSYVAGWGCPT